MLMYVFQHIGGAIYAIFLNLWINKKNPKYYGPVFTVFLAVSYTSGLLQLFLSWILFVLIVLLSIISGLSVVLCRGDHRKPPAPRPTSEQQSLSHFMQKLTRNLKKHYYTPRLVVSKDYSKAIQEVIDLVIRDFCLSAWLMRICPSILSIVAKDFVS